MGSDSLPESTVAWVSNRVTLRKAVVQPPVGEPDREEFSHRPVAISGTQVRPLENLPGSVFAGGWMP